MAFTTPSPNLGLPVPNLNDPGPDYATNVSACLNGLDAAIGGAVSGIGKSVVDLSAQPTSGNISADGYNFSNARSVEFANQSSELVGSQDVNCLYIFNNVLGWNDSNGLFHALTSGGGGGGGGGGLIYITTFTGSNETILPTDTYNWINVDTSSGPVTVQLPVIATLPSGSSSGRFFYFNDESGTFGTNALTIMVQGSSGNVLMYNGANGFGTATINWKGGAALAYTDGSNTWFVIPLNQMYYGADNIVYHGSNIQMQQTSLIMDQLSGLSLPGTITNNNSGAYTPQLNVPINIVSGGSVDGNINSQVANGITTTVANGIVSSVSGGITVTSAGGILSTIAGGIKPTADHGILSDVTGGIVTTITRGLESLVAGGIQSMIAAGIDSGVVGGIKPGVVGGIQSDIAGGIESTTSAGILTTTSGGFALGGGGYDYPIFTDNTGTSSPRSRTVQFPLLPMYLSAGWVVGSNPLLSGAYSNGANVVLKAPTTNPVNSLYVQIPALHNGATLASVAVFLSVLPNGSSRDFIPANLPAISVFRTSIVPGANPASNFQYLSTTQWQAIATPVSPPAYYDGGLIQVIVFTCNQFNVVDTSQYTYTVEIQDESGSGSYPGNYYYAGACNYSNITDMRFQ